ncbi:hypothetical protein Tco_0486728 [Tanacetum coccineum]
MSYNEKTGVYSCQVDEQWFDLSADLLRKALAITPVNPTSPFDLHSIGAINPYSTPVLDGKDLLAVKTQTSPFSANVVGNRPLKLMLIMPELKWEEFTQGTRHFSSTSKQGHKAILKNPKKKSKLLLLIPLDRFFQSDIYYLAIRKGKPAFQLVDEEDEAQQESIPPRLDDDPDHDLAKKLSLEAHQEKGEEEGNDADLERAIKLSLDPAFLPQGRAPVGGVTIRDPVSEATPKLHEVVGKGKAVVTEEQVAHSLIDLSKKKRTTDQFILVRRDQTPPDSTTGPSSRPDDDTSEKNPEKAHEALAGPDPEPMKEDQTGSDSGKLHVSLAGPNPEHMDDEFLATAYPKVYENLKLITDERVIDD